MRRLRRIIKTIVCVGTGGHGSQVPPAAGGLWEG